MSVLNDSDAFFAKGQMLRQHQAALTILKGVFANPTLQVKWLDLGCGKGQIIANFEKQFDDAERARLEYTGYDINAEHAKTAERVASSLGFANHCHPVGDLSDFSNVLGHSDKFDFICMTNAVHEISPQALAKLFYDSIDRLAPEGILFAYDMSELPLDALELGAITWTASEVKEIFESLYKASGVSGPVQTSSWDHKVVTGWSLQVHRKFCQSSTAHDPGEAVQETTRTITTLLEKKLESTRGVLEALTKFGAQTAEEADSKPRILHDFWALSRALGLD